MKHPILYAFKSHKSECELKIILIRFFHEQIMSFAVRIIHFSQVSLLFLIGKFREILKLWKSSFWPITVHVFNSRLVVINI